MSGLVDWLCVFRANTMPVVLLTVLAGFLAAGGSLISPLGAGFITFAWLFHHFSFGLNSLLDAPYDALNKPRDHALASGAISIGAAALVIHTGLFLTALLGCALALSGGGSASLSLAFLLLSVVLGYAYNAGLSRTTAWSSAPLSLSFVFLFLFAHFATTVSPTPLVPVLAAYIYLTFWFEHSWEGNLKDLGESGANLLHNLGVKRRRGRLEIPRPARAYAWGIKLAGIGLITLAIFAGNPTLPARLLWFVLASMALYSCHELTCGGRWSRVRLLFWTACEELSSFSLIPTALISTAGAWSTCGLIVFSFTWTVVLSHVMYGLKRVLGTVRRAALALERGDRN
jgi:hypothetical protein